MGTELCDKSTEPSDNDLMVSYAYGNEQAFSTLFERYSSKLGSFLRYRLSQKQTHLTEEIYQKTWLKVHSARKSFDPTHRFSTWFYTIALNTLRDEVGSSYEKSVREEIDPNRSSEESNSEDRLLVKERFHQVEALLRFLSESQRTALLLADWEELESKEIAEVMKISDASARQLVSRARREIRKLYDQALVTEGARTEEKKR
ncbi:MAG: RNA polymerase sigma factor [Bdellovibrionales bacterium]|nr:RNA polymerase sigma factor [Bdellovibrionales bacterium]